MKKLQQFDKELIFNYKPSIETMQLGLWTTQELAKLNLELQALFNDERKAARIFAFIESKYSSKVEGIYTTLFDVVNTGLETKQQNIIKPLVDELFNSKEGISVKKLRSLEEIMNNGVTKEKRFNVDFGIYQTIDGKKKKIYQPPMNEKEIDELLSEVVEKSLKDNNIVEMLHTHIMFEKVHPFADANGRLGRLILQKSISRLLNFTSVVPLSHAIFSKLSEYYSSFDIYHEVDLDNSLNKLLNIVLSMCGNTLRFISALDAYKSSNIDFIFSTSNKVTSELADDIIFTLQTKVPWMVKHHKINRKTVDSIFNKLSKKMDFNRKIVSKKVTYWNIDLEGIIDLYYR